MADDRGRPKLGETASALGLRLDRDIEVDQQGLVHRPQFRPGEKNGLSCSPRVEGLPGFILPVEWGGRNKHTVVWEIDTERLDARLTAVQDGLEHVSIGPSRTMTYEEYVEAIQETVADWAPVNPADEDQ